jgi:hypothetical protein
MLMKIFNFSFPIFFTLLLANFFPTPLLANAIGQQQSNPMNGPNIPKALYSSSFNREPSDGNKK